MRQVNAIPTLHLALSLGNAHVQRAPINRPPAGGGVDETTKRSRAPRPRGQSSAGSHPCRRRIVRARSGSPRFLAGSSRMLSAASCRWMYKSVTHTAAGRLRALRPAPGRSGRRSQAPQPPSPFAASPPNQLNITGSVSTINLVRLRAAAASGARAAAKLEPPSQLSAVARR